MPVMELILVVLWSSLFASRESNCSLVSGCVDKMGTEFDSWGMDIESFTRSYEQNERNTSLQKQRNTLILTKKADVAIDLLPNSLIY